jgi:tetratricopeptide (TPR) repeat protein
MHPVPPEPIPLRLFPALADAVCSALTRVYASTMGDGSSRHAALTVELHEWLEDLWGGMTSRVVLLAVPPGWGRSTILDQLAAAADADDVPVTLISRIHGRELPDGVGVQASILCDELAHMKEPHLAAELLGLDRLEGVTQLGLGVGGLFVSGLGAAVGFLVAGLAIGAAGKVWDDSPAGQDGALARAARAVAATSTEVSVLVVIDDADSLDEGVALTLIENLAARRNGHLLVIAAVNPGGSLQRELVSRARQGITEGLVRVADTDSDMGFAARADLARELCPGLPGSIARRIGGMTSTFADVFVLGSSPRLAEALDEGASDADLLELVRTVATARLQRPAPSPEAVVTAWAGGLLHSRQAEKALAAIGQPRAAEGDPDVLRHTGLERVADPASPRLAPEATLSSRDRAAMAVVLAEEALKIAADPQSGLAEQMAAAQATHHVRGDLADRSSLLAVQRHLTAALEELGETAAALEVVAAALRELPDGASLADRDWLQAAALRLSSCTFGAIPPEAAALIDEAVAHGSALGLEARVWATAELLRDSSQREAALTLTDQVATVLDEHASALGSAADRWRLLLAFRAGGAGYPDISTRLLAPLVTCGDNDREEVAQAVLRACAGPAADIRLQNIILEAEFSALPLASVDDRCRLHHVLALNYYTLGEYNRARTNGQHELALLALIPSSSPRQIFTIRGNVATWTGECGDTEGALRLYRELLPDMERVLGHSDPDTVTARGNYAGLVGKSGDAEGALRLYRELLPDMARVLGPYRRDTLTARNNYAGLVGECGDAEGALRLYRELLPDMARTLGLNDPDTLSVRGNVANWTGQCGDADGALRLYQELLRDREQLLGRDHPDILIARGNLASWIGQGGDADEALRLLLELLPEIRRVLGPAHPHTLTTLGNLAGWTGVCGDAQGAVRLYRQCLRDREQVLGREHPDTLATRNNVEYWTRMAKQAGRRR